jgi:hypothetical protein
LEGRIVVLFIADGVLEATFCPSSNLGPLLLGFLSAILFLFSTYFKLLLNLSADVPVGEVGRDTFECEIVAGMGDRIGLVGDVTVAVYGGAVLISEGAIAGIAYGLAPYALAAPGYPG